MPHDPELTRYRIYALRKRQLVLLAETSRTGVTAAIEQLREDGEFDDGEAVGVLDREESALTGSWVVNPYASG